MKNLRNIPDLINSPHGIDHIFSQMQEFLNTITIQSKEDIVAYFNTLIKYANEIIAFYYDNRTKQIDKDFSATIRDDDDHHLISEEGKYHEIIDFLLHELYDLENNNFQRQINHKTAFKDEPITANDIAIGHNDTHSGTLQEISAQESFPQILNEFQQTIQKTNNKISWMLEKENRAKQQQMQIKKQKNIEKKQSKAIQELLSSNDSDITKYESSYAREEDFADGYYSVKNIIKEIYAEKEEYFNNIFLGFDLQNGKFKTSTEKEKQYQKYFLDKGKPIVRLQEAKIDTSKNLPVLISQASSDILNIMHSNTKSILQTDEQKIEEQMKNSVVAYFAEEQKEEIRRIILERYQRQKAETDEEKMKIIRKVIGTYHNTRYHKRRKLDIDLPISSDIKIYIANHIRGCYDQSWRMKRKGVEEKMTTLPDARKESISRDEEKMKQDKKLIGEKVFGEGFDFEEVKKNEGYIRDVKFYSMGGYSNIRRAQIMALNGMYEGKIGYERIKEFMEEMDLLDGNHKEKIQETLETHAFLQDIEKIKKIEKDIQERFDASFILDSDKLCTILHAIIKHIFDNRMLFRESGVSNIENEIIAMTKRMSLYGTMYNHDTSFILQAFEQGQNDLKEYYQIEIFLAIVKKLGLTIQYNKENIKEILQKEYNQIQYNINHFGVYQINEIEKIKKTAADLGIKLVLPHHPPLEEYYIHRLRTPERILDKQSKENFYNEYEGTVGYDKGNLASIAQLEGFSQNLGMSLRREEVLNIDMRTYRNTPKKFNFDVDITVPVAVNFPKVQVLLKGNRDEKGSIQGHYIFFYDPKKHLYSLIFDDSFMNAELLIQKYKLTDQVILGGGFLMFNKETSSVLIEDRIDGYHHEPRILTITSLKNAIKDILPDYKIFIGNDGMDKMKNYF